MNFNDIEYIINNIEIEIEIEKCIDFIILNYDYRKNDRIKLLLGIGNQKLRKYNAAIFYYKKIEKNEKFNQAVNYNLGLCYIELKDYIKSIDFFSKNLKIKNHNIDNEFQIGFCYLEVNNFTAAIKYFYKVIANSNSHDQISKCYFNIGNSFYHLNNYIESIKNYNLSLYYNNNLKTLINLGVTYIKIKNYIYSEKYLNESLIFGSDNIDVYLNLGIVYLETSRFDKSEYYLNKALFIDKKNKLVIYNIAVLKYKRRDYRGAAEYFELVIGDDVYLKNLALGYLVICYLFLADWNKFSRIRKFILENINSLIIEPLSLMVFINSNLILLNNNSKYNKNYINKIEVGKINRNKSIKKNRIKLGFYSPDFRFHPVSIWLTEQIENHDKNLFELYAFSFQSNYNDPMRQRLEKAFDHFLIVDNLSNLEVINLSRLYEIDIAIDLTGYTQDNRTEIFSSRVAPIQINHLGFPGTSGSNYIDYFLTDHYSIPIENQIYFTEKIEYVECLYTYDRKRIINTKELTRNEFGLNENSIVFTCQNSTYKILPEIFSIWLNLLKRINNSVLWIQEPESDTIANLKNELNLKGIEENRLIFLRKEKVDQINEYERVSKYLASYKLADIFLDTFPYNGGTTVVDALWAEIPVVTISGETMVSRMAKSALNSIGLSELVTTSLIEYEELAYELAVNKSKLNDLKVKIKNNKPKYPLFNNLNNIKQIEKKYNELFNKSQAI
jgi:predicted O-linked N-acetylglucosamine transferase (SPINDLY family)